MKPVDINPERIVLAGSDNKIAKPLDYVLSRIDLKENEYLLIKVGTHMVERLDEIKRVIDLVFKREGDRVFIFVDGDISFEKATFQK